MSVTSLCAQRASRSKRCVGVDAIDGFASTTFFVAERKTPGPSPRDPFNRTQPARREQLAQSTFDVFFRALVAVPLAAEDTNSAMRAVFRSCADLSIAIAARTTPPRSRGTPDANELEWCSTLNALNFYT